MKTIVIVYAVSWLILLVVYIISLFQDKKSKKSPYSMRLCKLVMGTSEEPLWNNDWLKSNLTSELPYDSIVNKETLKKVTPVIVFRETRAYLEEIY